MGAYTDTLSPNDPFWEKCARHTSSHTARSLHHIYLCDPCVRRLVAEALNGRSPVYHGETVKGYCELCNAPGQVTLRLFFSCTICWNVIGSYQKAFVSSASVRDFWTTTIEPHCPEYDLQETEEVYLSPFARGRSTKRAAAETLQALDFLVSEIAGSQATPRFHIELKTGPGSIADMGEFQLDVNDYNDIVGAMLRTKLPAYVFHVKLDVDYRLPTRRAVATGLWWTDIVTLTQHQKRIAARRGEDKRAIYFDPAAFRDKEEFGQVLQQHEFEALARKIKRAGLHLVD